MFKARIMRSEVRVAELTQSHACWRRIHAYNWLRTRYTVTATCLVLVIFLMNGLGRNDRGEETTDESYSSGTEVFRRFKDARRIFSVPGWEARLQSTVGTNSGLKCSQWVVVTLSSPIPVENLEQYTNLTDWCTVVVLPPGMKAPPKPSSGSLTFLSDPYKPYHIRRHIFKRNAAWKNFGYLFAIEHGSTVIFDVDENIVLLPGARLTIPAEFEPKMVAEIDTDHPFFNPYPIFGAPGVWPRGFPGHSIADSLDFDMVKVSNVTSGLLFHQIPGRAIAIYQSMVNNDYRARTGLEQYVPVTFRDPAVTLNKPEAVYVPAGTLAPYTSGATLHHSIAFWGLLLPASVDTHDADIWRGYITQRLLWDVAGRIAFTAPIARQQHMPNATYTNDAALEAKTESLVKFLRNWAAPDNATSVPMRVELLAIALFEAGHLELDDVYLTQAWLQDLGSVGYKFPTVWSSSPTFDRPFGGSALGAMFTLLDEHNGGEDILRALPSWNANLTMLARHNYPFLIFYVDVPSFMTDILKSKLREAAPNLRLEFYATQYSIPMRVPKDRSLKNTGYKFCSQFLAYEVYRHPAVRGGRFQYIVRADEDSFLLESVEINLFEFMKIRGLDVLGVQKALESRDVVGHLVERATSFASRHAAELPSNATAVPAAWQNRPQDLGLPGPMALLSGWFEVYKLSLFTEPLYFTYLSEIDFIEGDYVFDWREQSFKTVWMLVKTDRTRMLWDQRALLPGLWHKKVGDNSW